MNLILVRRSSKKLQSNFWVIGGRLKLLQILYLRPACQTVSKARCTSFVRSADFSFVCLLICKKLVVRLSMSWVERLGRKPKCLSVMMFSSSRNSLSLLLFIFSNVLPNISKRLIGL